VPDNTQPFTTRLLPPLAVVLAAAVVALAAGAAVYSWIAGKEPAELTASGMQRLFEASFPDVSGKPQPLAQWRGKVVVVNFWATWCAPCREEMPDLIKLQQQYGPKGLQLVGIAIDENGPVTSFLERLPVNYPVLVGGFAATRLNEAAGNGHGGLPYTVVIDRAGQPVDRYLGRIELDRLTRTINKLL